MNRISLLAPFATFIGVFVALAMPAAIVSQKPAAEAAQGKRIFAQSCASCHDAVGTTTKSGPALKSYYRRQPRPPPMPRSGESSSKAEAGWPPFTSFDKPQVDDLVAYLKTL
jgi:mono/diheme cytochrome c family protein